MLLIPRIFHRIWLGPRKMPAEFAAWGESWAHCNPGWEMKLWTDSNLPALRNRYVYDQTRGYAYRSDILRLELIHTFGGVYIDTDFECFRCIEPLLEDRKYVLFEGSSMRVPNAAFGAVPRHPLIEMLLDGVQQSWYRGNRGEELAGPIYFRRKLARHTDISYLPRVLFFPGVRISPAARRELKLERPEMYAAHYRTSLGR